MKSFCKNVDRFTVSNIKNTHQLVMLRISGFARHFKSDMKQWSEKRLAVWSEKKSIRDKEKLYVSACHYHTNQHSRAITLALSFPAASEKKFLTEAFSAAIFYYQNGKFGYFLYWKSRSSDRSSNRMPLIWHAKYMDVSRFAAENKSFLNMPIFNWIPKLVAGIVSWKKSRKTFSEIRLNF